MKAGEASVRFEEPSGRLRAIQVRRSSARPIVSLLHRSLFALGIIVTSYQVQTTAAGLEERLELSSEDGKELDEVQAQHVKQAVLPLALDAD